MTKVRAQRTDERGFSMIEVLVAAGIMGVVIMTLISLFTDMTKMRERAVQAGDADNMIQYLKGALRQPKQCNGSMHFANATVRWPNVDQPTEVDSIVVGTQVLLAKSQCLSQILCVQSMFIRQPNPAAAANGEVARVATPTNIVTGGVMTPYTVYGAFLEITFTNPGATVSGGALRKHLIPLSLARNNTSGTLDYCFQDAPDQQDLSDFTCTTVTPGGTSCGGGCNAFYYVSGFDGAGKPICSCQIGCKKLHNKEL